MALHLLSFKETRSSLSVHNSSELHTAIFKGTLRRLRFLKGISNLDSRCGVCPPSFRGLNNCVRSFLWVTTMCSCSHWIGAESQAHTQIAHHATTVPSGCGNHMESSGWELLDQKVMWKMCFLVHVALRSYVGPDLLVEKMAKDFVIHAK